MPGQTLSSHRDLRCAIPYMVAKKRPPLPTNFDKRLRKCDNGNPARRI